MTRYFVMEYEGYDLVITIPEELTTEDCEAELRKTIEAHPEMTFKKKNWKTPKEMVS